MQKDGISDKTIDHFIGPASRFIFDILGLSTSFLEEDVRTWETLPSYYQTAK